MLYDYRKKVKQFSRKIIIIIIMHMNSKAYSMHGTQFTITRLLLKINFSNHIETVWIKTCWMSIQHLTNISLLVGHVAVYSLVIRIVRCIRVWVVREVIAIIIDVGADTGRLAAVVLRGIAVRSSSCLPTCCGRICCCVGCCKMLCSRRCWSTNSYSHYCSPHYYGKYDCSNIETQRDVGLWSGRNCITTSFIISSLRRRICTVLHLCYRFKCTYTVCDYKGRDGTHKWRPASKYEGYKCHCNR